MAQAFPAGHRDPVVVVELVLAARLAPAHVHPVDAFEGERRTFSRNWQETAPRDLL